MKSANCFRLEAAKGGHSRLQPIETYESLGNTNTGSAMYQITCLNWGTSPTTSYLSAACPAMTPAANNNGTLQSVAYLNGGPSYNSSSGYLTFTDYFWYDSLKRMTAVNDKSGTNETTGALLWGENFSYDRWGNMWLGNAAAGLPTNPSRPMSNVYNPNGVLNNRRSDGVYDAAGNQLNMPGIAGMTLAYDAENRVTQITGSGTDGYLYDGLGQRVQKTVSSSPTVYVYDGFGQLAAEYAWTVAAAPPCTTCYVSMDWLGSVRMVTDGAGSIMGRHDYTSYGEEIGTSADGRDSTWGPYTDNVNQKFTGQERDPESTLDYFYARYYSAGMSRFMSADPGNAGADVTDPQSWNGYAYVRNTPSALVDPNGASIWSWFQNLWNKINGSSPAPGDPENPVWTEDPGGDPDYNNSIYQFYAWSYYTPPTSGGSSSKATSPAAFNPGIPPSLLLNPPNNGRNCTPSSASAGQYALSTAAVAGMTAEFFSGIGAQDRTFGADSSVSAVMGQSGGVQSVLNNYYMTGQTSGLYSFGGAGYANAGANPVAQFVGSFRYSISPGAGGINLSLTNTTSFRSLTFDVGPQWGRHTQYPGAGVPMGNTHQIYNVFVPCKVG